jgi:hemerythrin-like domain-containing protein
MDDELFSRHHAELDQRIAVLLTKADGDDCHELANAWNGFERELMRHFELEEHELFQHLMPEHPEDIAALRQDHEALRRDLLALGIRADLHCLRAEAVRAFITDLRAHAAREEQTLYRWASRDVEGDTWARIARGLREARDSAVERLGDELSQLGARTL